MITSFDYTFNKMIKTRYPDFQKQIVKVKSYSCKKRVLFLELNNYNYRTLLHWTTEPSRNQMKIKNEI